MNDGLRETFFLRINKLPTRNYFLKAGIKLFLIK